MLLLLPLTLLCMRESHNFENHFEQRHADSELTVSNGISRLTIDRQVIESNLLACGITPDTIQNIQNQLLRIEEIKRLDEKEPQSVGGYAMRFYITKDLMNATHDDLRRYNVTSVELSLIARLISYLCHEEAIFVPGQTRQGPF